MGCTAFSRCEGDKAGLPAPLGPWCEHWLNSFKTYAQGGLEEGGAGAQLGSEVSF